MQSWWNPICYRLQFLWNADNLLCMLFENIFGFEFLEFPANFFLYIRVKCWTVHHIQILAWTPIFFLNNKEKSLTFFPQFSWSQQPKELVSQFESLEKFLVNCFSRPEFYSYCWLVVGAVWCFLTFLQKCDQEKQNYKTK